MKYFLAIPAMLLFGQAMAAGIYTCTDGNGKKIYTQNAAASGCKKADIGRPSIYSSLPAKPAAAISAPAREPVAENDNPAGAAAQKKLDDALKALEEGKKVRYGNERNYALYLQRIAGLEEEVKKAQDELKRHSGGGTPAAGNHMPVVPNGIIEAQ